MSTIMQAATGHSTRGTGQIQSPKPLSAARCWQQGLLHDTAVL